MAEDRPGEFDLIRRFFAPLATDPGSLGLTDDAAVLSPRAGMDLVLTKDVLAADVHFFSQDAPEAVAAKALRVNLSDLASKGARPLGYLLGLALPSDWNTDWLERFCKGLAGDQAAYDVHLLGGDTIRSGETLQISVTAIGEVDEGGAVRRCGARPGDLLFVTGTIGDGAAGLQARLHSGYCEAHGLSEAEEKHILCRYLLPQPRTRLAPVLLQYASAAMDVSDGLFADSGHLSGASDVEIVIDMEKVPLSGSLERLRTAAPDEFLRCLDGGDDYEILATVSPDNAAAFKGQAEAAGCPVSQIGTIVEGKPGVRLLDDGRPVDLSKRGFRHF
ncbi:thiamine-phosphate kinase [Rhodobacterales bacterium]|nr:thiamine-phosphate kinase [Rhodobacterales bacterium]